MMNSYGWKISHNSHNSHHHHHHHHPLYPFTSFDILIEIITVSNLSCCFVSLSPSSFSLSLSVSLSRPSSCTGPRTDPESTVSTCPFYSLAIETCRCWIIAYLLYVRTYEYVYGSAYVCVHVCMCLYVCYVCCVCIFVSLSFVSLYPAIF